jgi:hypothetical protein
MFGEQWTAVTSKSNFRLTRRALGPCGGKSNSRSGRGIDPPPSDITPLDGVVRRKIRDRMGRADDKSGAGLPCWVRSVEDLIKLIVQVTNVTATALARLAWVEFTKC